MQLRHVSDHPEQIARSEGQHESCSNGPAPMSQKQGETGGAHTLGWDLSA